MSTEWFVDKGVNCKSFYVVRRPDGWKSPYDLQFYVSPGKKWPRRFREKFLAQEFADSLNRQAKVQP